MRSQNGEQHGTKHFFKDIHKVFKTAQRNKTSSKKYFKATSDYVTFISVKRKRRQISHKRIEMPRMPTHHPSIIRFHITYLMCDHCTSHRVLLIANTHIHTSIHTNTHTLSLTHPMRETICSTMCLLKVMITNSFCMTKTHRERARQLLNLEVKAVHAS